jgi:hypothetical protein
MSKSSRPLIRRRQKRLGITAVIVVITIKVDFIPILMRMRVINPGLEKSQRRRRAFD